MAKTNAQYLNEKLAALKGFTFAGVQDGENPADVTLVFTKGEVSVGVAVQSDEEGNGPGWVEVLTVEGPPTKVDALVAKLGS